MDFGVQLSISGTGWRWEGQAPGRRVAGGSDPSAEMRVMWAWACAAPGHVPARCPLPLPLPPAHVFGQRWAEPERARRGGAGTGWSVCRRKPRAYLVINAP